MKHTQYSVIYLNDMHEIFYANGFTEAIIAAMYFAMTKGWDKRIKYITDENDVTIKDIKYPEYEFSKQTNDTRRRKQQTDEPKQI
jgi:hypothetical protein